MQYPSDENRRIGAGTLNPTSAPTPINPPAPDDLLRYARATERRNLPISAYSEAIVHLVEEKNPVARDVHKWLCDHGIKHIPLGTVASHISKWAAAKRQAE